MSTISTTNNNNNNKTTPMPRNCYNSNNKQQQTKPIPCRFQQLTTWGHQWFCHVSKYNKIASNGATLQSLKLPVVSHCLKYKIAGDGGKFKFKRFFASQSGNPKISIFHLFFIFVFIFDHFIFMPIFHLPFSSFGSSFSSFGPSKLENDKMREKWRKIKTKWRKTWKMVNIWLKMKKQKMKN